jgi:beta-galactosidase/beta-glucuronidase
VKLSFEQTNPNLKNFRFEIKNAQGILIAKGNDKEAKIIDNQIIVEIERPKSMAIWDEFNPNLYSVTVNTADGTAQARFGFSSIKNNEGVLSLNNHRIFLRGNLECFIFPLTGHPPMLKAEWAKLIKQAKSYGLNHLRFHSWCPPNAAFEAAEVAGFYLLVELLNWHLKVGSDAPTNDFLQKEAAKILADYGNHPSFLMLTLGNELEGDVVFMNKMVADLRKIKTDGCEARTRR